MKPIQFTFAISLCLLMLAIFTGCSNKEQTAATNSENSEQVSLKEKTSPPEPTQLPVRYQNPGYVVSTGDLDTDFDQQEEFTLKVGANITSTKGPQPLWDILKRLANLKGMSVSWASDVDQNVLVDVNIKADDDFYKSIDNLLRQVDYFQESQGNTIIVKYKETKRFYISVPYMKGNYTTTVGGNYLTDRDAATGTEGTVKITSNDNTFDIWENLQTNLDVIMEQWTTTASAPEPAEATGNETETSSEETVQTEPKATRRLSQGGAYYTVDKSIGLITVTAPRPLLDKVETYLSTLKKELYRQVIIEAKIIEVTLKDNSRIGLDWSQVLKNFDVSGIVQFGHNGQVYPWNSAIDPETGDPYTRFISKVSLFPASFNLVLNALNEQGDATVLSNPKLTVLNGQPALISVGKDITYIKEVTSDYNAETATVTYTAKTDSVVEGIALGVMASIIDDDSVILHLTPITTDLLQDPIEYRQIGGEAIEIGLPRVGIREMSTMVQVDNGEMLIIGGLIDSVEGKTGEFAPIVGSIPIVKYLFGVEEKQLEKRELVILLTPRII